MGASADELVVLQWRAMMSAGTHRQPDRPLDEVVKRSGWKAEYAGRIQASCVTPHEAFEDMTSAHFESIGHSGPQTTITTTITTTTPEPKVTADTATTTTVSEITE